MCNTQLYIRRVHSAKSTVEIQEIVDEAMTDPMMDLPEMSQLNYQANVAAHKLLLKKEELTNG